MRIRTAKTKNGRLFYVIKTYYDSHGVEHTVTVEKLGNENDIKARTGRILTSGQKSMSQNSTKKKKSRMLM